LHGAAHGFPQLQESAPQFLHRLKSLLAFAQVIRHTWHRPQWQYLISHFQVEAAIDATGDLIFGPLADMILVFTATARAAGARPSYRGRGDFAQSFGSERQPGDAGQSPSGKYGFNQYRLIFDCQVHSPHHSHHSMGQRPGIAPRSHLLGRISHFILSFHERKVS